MSLDPGMVVAGFVYAGLVGHQAVRSTVRLMGRLEDATDGRRPAPERAGLAKERQFGPSHTSAVGHVERMIYVSAVVLGRPEFAGGWLVIKAATNLGAAKFARVTLQRRFNRWLVGSGLSLVFGVAGGLIATTPPERSWSWWLANPWPIAISLGLWVLLALAYGRDGPVSLWLRGTELGPDDDPGRRGEG